jgi:hypothetical protein
MAHYIKDCPEKIKNCNGDKLPEGCWRDTLEYCVIKDSSNYKKEDV